MDILISSDFGLKWGNVTITPSELANYIEGINIVNGLLELDEVKFGNIEGKEYIRDSLGVRHNLVELYERIQGT